MGDASRAPLSRCRATPPTAVPARCGGWRRSPAAAATLRTPTSGNWFGRTFAEPLDLTGRSTLKFDVKTGATGTTGEFAAGRARPHLVPGRRLGLDNANSSRTIKQKFTDIACPAGVTLDPTQIRSVWIFLNGTDVSIDNVRAR